MKELIAQVNAIRRQHPALQQNATLRFHASSTDALLWFSKTAASATASAGQVHHDVVFVAANTTPADVQHGWVEVPIAEFGIPPDASYTAAQHPAVPSLVGLLSLRSLHHA